VNCRTFVNPEEEEKNCQAEPVVALATGAIPLIDVSICPDCVGRLRVIADVTVDYAQGYGASQPQKVQRAAIA